MSLGFDLLSEDTFWREGVAKGSYINRRWVPLTAPASEEDFEVAGEPFLVGGVPFVVTGTYATFTGNWEPYSNDETSIILPEGVSGKNTLVLFTSQDLSVHNDLAGHEILGSVIYLESPLLVSNTPAYVVTAKQHWKGNSGFSLMEGYNEYLVTRKEKQ